MIRIDGKIPVSGTGASTPEAISAQVPASKAPPSTAPADGIESGGTATLERPDATITTGTTASAELLKDIKTLLVDAGAITGDVGDFADVFFSVGDLRAFPLSVGARSKQAVDHLVKDVAAYASAGGTTNLDIAASFEGVVNQVKGDTGSMSMADIHALVQWVLRESYMETTYDLRHFAEKVKAFNAQKKALRDHMAKLRDIQSKLAGVPEDQKANTNLAGAGGTTGPGGTGGAAGSAPDGGPPFIESPEQRAKDYPEAHALVAEFTAYSMGGGLTGLENYLLNDSTAQQRLLQAIPYMTTEELVNVMRAFGGNDMKVRDEVKHLWGEMLNAMTPQQLLEIGALRESGAHKFKVWFITWGDLFGGQLKGMLQGRINAAKAQTESATGRTFSKYADAAQAFSQHRAKAIEEAKEAEAARLAAEAAAAAAQDAEPQDAEPQGAEAPATPTSMDLDAADGAIDAVVLASDPPYIRPDPSGKRISTVAELEAHLKALEEQLSCIGDDAQLANVDMQNTLQKQQQTMQMMSNIAKQLHDTQMAIIRKIGG